MAVVIALVLVAIGSVTFHVLSPWWWTPIASNWGYIDGTLTVTFWITGVVFTAIVLFMAYCVLRFRHRPDHTAEFGPENKRLEWWLTIGTTVGVCVLLAPGLVVWHQFVTVPASATEVEIVGQQWRWSYRLPGRDGRLGTVAVRWISPENPLGIDPADVAGQDDVIIEGGDLQLPIGRPVKILLRAIDVVHNFYVPAFRAKMDMVPGQVTFFWFTPTRTGAFEGICAELCGLGHAVMRARVVVVEAPEYDAWLERQPTFAPRVASVQ
ncbi:cytochrome c oxidase subunit II [Sabulicella rubraurantiaca]|uniref:cytochrome c oxidase subunit II n=1 Tax=Sabulicella rubraurantiaca TaxID=2811429 RepID=UPI001A95F101|nr:cytochrome c oxidase subunit II [Sabulicella rubraurantiaca]